MVAIAIDFKKAYDSIKRETMVQIVKELRIDSKIIDFIVRIYRDDSTKIQLEKNEGIEIEVTSGIRQGCTASTVPGKFHPRKFHPRKFHSAKIPPT